MGLPALREQPRAGAGHRPHLRVVSSSTGAKKSGPKAKSKPKSRAAAHRAAHQAFVFFAVITVVAAGFGAGRVWLSVQAAQASIDSGKLRSAIKAASYEGDMLEIQKSALASPSRIQHIAVGQLGMAPATSVSYMRIDSGEAKAAPPATRSAVATTEPRMLDTLVEIAAAQARLLLVGDVGLSSLR
jgi:cell division protein FtsL